MASRKGRKKITQQTVIGQLGVNLVEQRVLRMGLVWYPTGDVEAGIDGHVEIRDPETGEVTNCVLGVQSKATEGQLGTAGSSSFEYVCDERDIDYWMNGNLPVILARSKPSTEEVFWVSIKDYFRDPERRRSRKVVFDKQRDRFDETARDKLVALAVPAETGVYFAPAHRRESVYSNLLPVRRVADHLYLADTELRSPKEVWKVLSEVPDIGGEWILRNKRILSVHDLREPPWPSVCDRGTVEDFPLNEWANTEDRDQTREYVWLLNQCLRGKCRQIGLHYSSAQGCFYFPATRDLTPRKVTYRSQKREVARTVFRGYLSGGRTYYRHSAFEGRFRRYDGQWYLEVTPTYFYSTDGREPDSNYENRLKGIKAQERNSAVRNQVLLWADLFSRRRKDLFQSASYRYLEFGALLKFELNAGLEDELWLKRELDEAEDSATLSLFER